MIQNPVQRKKKLDSHDAYVAFKTPPSPKQPKLKQIKSKSPPIHPIESTIGTKSGRSFSIDSMADGNRRKNKKNGKQNIVVFCFVCVMAHFQK